LIHYRFLRKVEAEREYGVLAVFPGKRHWKTFTRLAEGIFIALLNTIVDDAFIRGATKSATILERQQWMGSILI